MRKWIAGFVLCLSLLLAGCGGGGSGDAPVASPEPRPTAANGAASAGAASLAPEAANAFGDLPTLMLTGEADLRTFEILPDQSKAVYIVDEELFADATRKYGLEVGKAKVTGATRDVDGTFQIDLANKAIGAIRFAVYLPSLRTDQRLRDGWIRDNALESSRFPLAVFIATGIRGAPADYEQGTVAEFQMLGDLTVREITVPTVWDVSATLSGDTLTGIAETRLRMTDFGFQPPDFANTLTVQDEFTVRLEFVAQAQQ